MTDLIERDFYARLPFEERPKSFLFGDEGKTLASHNSDADDNKEKEKKDVEAGAGEEEKSTNGAGEKKDEGKDKKSNSYLLRAIHSVFFWRWWSAGLMLLFAGQYVPFFNSTMSLTFLLSSRYPENNHASHYPSPAHLAHGII